MFSDTLLASIGEQTLAATQLTCSLTTPFSTILLEESEILLYRRLIVHRERRHSVATSSVYVRSRLRTNSKNSTTMASEVKAEKLVQTSLYKKTQPKAFVALLKQLNEKASIPDNELASALLSLLKDRSLWKLQHRYAFAFAAESDINIQKLMGGLHGLSIEAQREFILFLKSHYKSFPETVILSFVNKALPAYTVQYQGLLQSEVNEEIKNVWYHLLFLWGSIIDNVGTVILKEQFRGLALDIMSQLQSLGSTSQLAYFSKKANSLLNTADLHKELQAVGSVKREKVTATPVRKAFALNQHSKKVIKINRLKRLLWLNERFKQWRIEKLMEHYITFFHIDTSKFDEFVKDVVQILFNGISIAIQQQENPYVLFNWKNYIVSRFPVYLKESRPKNDGSSNLESVILKTVSGFNDAYITEMIVGGRSSHPYDLRKVFLRSCMYQDLVTVSSYTKTFPEDSESVTWSHITHEKSVLNHTDHLKSEFNSKLLNINTEFTSLSESLFINFLEELTSTDIQYLIAKQEQLLSLVSSSFEKLIKEKSNEKLVRLVLGLLICLPVTNYIYFVDPQGPWGIIDPLIAYIDNDSFGADADDNNFQETFSYFGILMTGSIAMTKFFGVDFVSVSLGNSYTIDFMNRFYYRLCANFTNRVEPEKPADVTTANKYNEILSEWANALFDVNNDGLSDDLIKSVNVKQIYKLVFVIFQGAITANIAGSLASPNLSNGIDYLSQDFLAPSSAEIIHWIVSNVGPLQRNSDIFLQILWKIIQSNLGENKEESSETNYIFQLVLNLVGKELLESLYSFRNWENKEIMLKVVRVVKKKADEEYNRVDRLLQLQKHKEGDSLVSTIRQALQAFLTLENEASEHTIWRAFRTMWKVTESDEILELLLNEIKLSHSNKSAHGSSAEEGRILIDFLAFLVVLTSQNSAEMSDSELKSRFNEVKPRGVGPMLFGNKFSLGMENHHSTILGGTVSQEEENKAIEAVDSKPPKDDLMMDFEMDDLFNDKGDDLFGDTGDAAISRPASPPMKVGSLYNDVVSGTSILRRILNQLLQTETEHHDAEVLKIVLLQQLEQFLMVKRVSALSQ